MPGTSWTGPQIGLFWNGTNAGDNQTIMQGGRPGVWRAD